MAEKKFEILLLYAIFNENIEHGYTDVIGVDASYPIPQIVFMCLAFKCSQTMMHKIQDTNIFRSEVTTILSIDVLKLNFK